MVLNSFLGERRVCLMMLSHPDAMLQLRPTVMSLAQRWGHLFVRLFGFPINPLTRMRARTVLSYLPKNNGKLLEIGCSFGVLAFELARRGYRVTGLDINAVSIELANKINGILKLNNVRFFNMDFIDNRFPAGEFDIVVTVEVLEHIKDDRRAIDEVYRVLKDDGVLIVSVPYAEITREYTTPVMSWRDSEGKSVTLGVPGELHFRNGYNREGLVSLLNSRGFKVVRCSYTSNFEILRKSMILFPLCYIAALVLSKLGGRRAKVTALAKKQF